LTILATLAALGARVAAVEVAVVAGDLMLFFACSCTSCDLGCNVGCDAGCDAGCGSGSCAWTLATKLNTNHEEIKYAKQERYFIATKIQKKKQVLHHIA